MSKMSEISIEIQQRLCAGESPSNISREMNIPIEWVEATVELYESQEFETYRNFDSVNS